MTSTTSDFEQFLVERLQIPAFLLPHAGEWSGTGNTIGALALRLGILDLPQIDEILTCQENDRRLFGEIAIDLGLLQQGEVDRLIMLQQFHLRLEPLERLMLEGHIDLTQLQQLLLDFSNQSKKQFNHAT